MTRLTTLGLIQMSVGEDREVNLSKAHTMIADAAKKGAQIICLPELFTTPYFPKDKKSTLRSEKIPGPTTNFLSKTAKKNKVVIVGGSIFEVDGKRQYNTCVVFDQSGRILGKYRKVHIPEDEGFYEQDYFHSGNSYRVFKTSLARVGALICFDQWYPEPVRAERMLGADVVFYPTAIGTVAGIEQSEGDWREAWEAVQRGHAIANSVVVAAVNRVGREKSTRFWGGSFVYNQFGKLLARADGDREEVLVVECDLGLGKQIEEGWGFIRNRKPKTYSKLLERETR